MSAQAQAAAAVAVPAGERCVLCGCRLTTTYWIERGLCGSCSERPESKRLARDAVGRALSPTRLQGPQAVPSLQKTPRPFTAADKSLIRKLHPHVSTSQLLQILNDRLVTDLGAAAVAYPIEQLQRELQEVVTVDAGGWTGVRGALRAAEKSGVLKTITSQLLEDFSVLYQLTPAQLMHLRDVIRHAQEGQ